MKTKSPSWNKSKCKENTIMRFFATKNINKIARTCGYLKRKTGKISPKSLIIGFMLMASKQRNTYSDWACEIGVLENKVISKQSLNERMNLQTECFIQKTLEQQLIKKVHISQPTKTDGLFSNFNNIMIEDSTTLHLPDELATDFPGNTSRGKRKAQAKIHAMYNLTKNNFAFFHLHSFSNNDQSLSSKSLPFLKRHDLCIRDLGFLVLEAIENFINKEIYFISRKKYQANVYDINTEEEINLVKLLRKKKFIDTEVLIGKKQKLKVRLIAIPLSKEQASERVRKAKQDRDKRLNHSSGYYELLGYSIYITNIDSNICNAENIFKLYKLRWNIEIIFKCWKSCFSIEKLIHHQCRNAFRVRCMIYLMLLYIYLFHVIWWHQCEKVICLDNQKKLSMLKIANFFCRHFEELLIKNTSMEIIMQIKHHCVYDTRKDRDNSRLYMQKVA